MAVNASIKTNFERVFVFGPFRLDAHERLLLKDGQPVALTPKVFDTLLLLVEEHGHLIGKEELMKAIWPDSFVEEVNLNRSISTLRRVLGEAPNEPQYIETVPKRGYRFIGQVTEVDREPAARRLLLDLTRSENSPPDGVNQTEPAVQVVLQPPGINNGIKLRGQFISRRALALGVGIALALFGLAYLATRSKPAQTENTTGPPEVASLAVLPFKVLGTTEQRQEVELGMTDVLITTLSNVKEINVRPTSAVLKYSNSEQSPAEIGRALKVNAVLEGSVQKVEGRIRVTVRLLNVSKEAPLWAGKFDEPAADILKVQDSIAERVAKALSVELKSPPYTQNVKAHELYVKGRLSFNQRDMGSIEKAEMYFRQAIDEDPNFALAYSGLSDLCTIHGDRSDWGENVLQKALKIGDTFGEVHASKGFRRMFSDWNWNEAEESFKRAIELKPGYAAAYQWYANLLAITGRLDEGIEMLRRGLEIDPTSHNLMADLGQFYYFARDYDKAIELCKKAIEINPDFPFSYMYLSEIYRKQGKYEESLDMASNSTYATLKKSYLPQTKPQTGKELLQQTGGWQGYIKAEIDNLKRVGEPSGYGLARMYLLLGDKQQALDNLDLAFKQHIFYLPFVGVDPLLDDLRSEPRYQDLLRRMGLTRWLGRQS